MDGDFLDPKHGLISKIKEEKSSMSIKRALERFNIDYKYLASIQILFNIKEELSNVIFIDFVSKRKLF